MEEYMSKVKNDTEEDLKEFNAYQQGFEDGKKYMLDNTAIEDQETYTKGYEKALEEFENLFVYENDYKQFFNDIFGNYTLYDITVKYGAKTVLEQFKNTYCT